MQPSELIQHSSDKLYKILSFDTFISPFILIIFYYIGAVIIPVLVFYLLKNYQKKHSDVLAGIKSIPGYGLVNGKLKAMLIFVSVFMAFEMIWRMMFEFVLAYLQIHEAMMALSVK